MVTLNKGNWLAQHERREHSQDGEDGILEKIFEILKIGKGWCVDVGAGDGKKSSNTYNLIQRHGWSGILIEGDPKRFSNLIKTHAALPEVHCVKQWVGFSSSDSLDTLLKEHPLPSDFDLISLDVDGPDIHLWEALQHYKPKVVIIEYNPTIPNEINFKQPRQLDLHQGNSLLALTLLGKEKGYQLIAITEANAIFTLDGLYPLFAIEDNGLDLMRPKASVDSELFQLYDGTLAFHDGQKLVWSGKPNQKDQLQIYPSFISVYNAASRLNKTLRKLLKAIYNRIFGRKP